MRSKASHFANSHERHDVPSPGLVAQVSSCLHVTLDTHVFGASLQPGELSILGELMYQRTHLNAYGLIPNIKEFLGYCGTDKR